MALFLTIREHEDVTFATSDGFVKISLVEVAGHKAKLAISAPSVIDIMRSSAKNKLRPAGFASDNDDLCEKGGQ